MKTIVRTAIVSAAMLLFAACHSTPSSSAGMTAANAKCPMKGEALEPGCPTCDYNGQKIGFCCTTCMKTFNGLSDNDKKTKVAASMSK
jgi:hypothetical protein